MPDWFESLTGFEERSYDETRSNLEVVGGTLRSRVNDRSYAIGELETPSLAELRARADGVATEVAGKLKASMIVADVGELHRDRANRHALFQVASQFNLLEMMAPNIVPEDGVTRYIHDRTQGPACAMAAGAATIYRNYFVPVGGGIGQTRDRQIDCLRDLGASLGNDNGALWTMRNGYALCTETGLEAIERRLRALNLVETDKLRGILRVGLHWNVEVTSRRTGGPLVSQAFCSALPVSYTRVPAERWTSFATLVLEGAYEATLLAAVLNAQRTGSNVVYLTQLGGGAFGNERSWIRSAIRRALIGMTGCGLDVRLVSYRQPDSELERFVREFA